MAYARCQEKARAEHHVVAEAIARVGRSYDNLRKREEQTPAFREFLAQYGACMARSGFPNVRSSDDAFNLAVVRYVEGRLPAEIWATERPIAIADFECVGKNRADRDKVRNEAKRKVTVTSEADLALVRRFTTKGAQ